MVKKIPKLVKAALTRAPEFSLATPVVITARGTATPQKPNGDILF